MNNIDQAVPSIPITLLPPPNPRFLLWPNRPPPIGHPLAPILRPLYLNIVNRQLAIEIKNAEWQNDLQHLFFDDRTDIATPKKHVCWAETIEVHEADRSDENEEEFSPPFPSRHTPAETEEEFNPPFPSRSTTHAMPNQTHIYPPPRLSASENNGPENYLSRIREFSDTLDREHAARRTR